MVLYLVGIADDNFDSDQDRERDVFSESTIALLSKRL